jgi:hypothetical protein
MVLHTVLAWLLTFAEISLQIVREEQKKNDTAEQAIRDQQEHQDFVKDGYVKRNFWDTESAFAVFIILNVGCGVCLRNEWGMCKN